MRAVLGMPLYAQFRHDPVWKRDGTRPVLLDEVTDRARERDRIVDVLFDLEADSRRAIEAFPVAEADARIEVPHMHLFRYDQQGRVNDLWNTLLS